MTDRRAQIFSFQPPGHGHRLSQVLAHNFRDYRFHVEVTEAALNVVVNAARVKGIDRLKAQAGHAAGDNAVLDVNGADAARLQHTEELRREIIHLDEELFVAFGVSEVGVVG